MGQTPFEMRDLNDHEQGDAKFDVYATGQDGEIYEVTFGSWCAGMFCKELAEEYRNFKNRQLEDAESKAEALGVDPEHLKQLVYEGKWKDGNFTEDPHFCSPGSTLLFPGSTTEVVEDQPKVDPACPVGRYTYWTIGDGAWKAQARGGNGEKHLVKFEGHDAERLAREYVSLMNSRMESAIINLPDDQRRSVSQAVFDGHLGT